MTPGEFWAVYDRQSGAEERAGLIKDVRAMAKAVGAKGGN